MAQSNDRGRFVWHELLTTDTKSAGKFFSKIIGWKTQAWGPDASYTLFVSGDRQAAGLMALPDEAAKMGSPCYWQIYISTPNVDESAALAKSLGATVVKAAEDIPNVGRFAVLKDPQGAVFGLYKPNRPPAPDAAPGLGDFSWHELVTTDQKGAFAFYQRLFGWHETSSMDMGEMGTYQMFGVSKQSPMGGIMNKPPQMPGPAWLSYIKVADARKTADAVKKAGAAIINGPMQVPGGDWIAQGVDAQGAMFAVHSAVQASAVAQAPEAPETPKAASPRRAKPAKKVGGRKKPAGVRKASRPKKGQRRVSGRTSGAARKAANARRPVASARKSSKARKTGAKKR
jgi:predicted enzyme related to lactoylglutathione lyase